MRYSLLHRAEAVQDQMTDKLLSPVDRNRGYGIRLNLSMLTQGTMRELIEMLNLAVARSRLLTPNEGRIMMGRAPLPGGDELMSPQGAPPVGAPIDGQSNEGTDDAE